MDHKSSRTALYDFGRDRYLAACGVVVPAVVPVLRYAGLSEDEPTDGTYWARVSRTVVDEGQETLRNGSSQRRFRSTGIVFVQLFVPRSVSRGQVHLDDIAELVRNDFRTYQGEDLEFTNARINDNVAPEPGWLRANIVSNYDYRQFIS